MLVAETLGEFAVAFQAPVVENDRNVMVDDGRVRLLDDQGTVKAPGNLFPGPVVGVVPVCAGMGNIERALLQPRGVGQRSELRNPTDLTKNPISLEQESNGLDARSAQPVVSPCSVSATSQPWFLSDGRRPLLCQAQSSRGWGRTGPLSPVRGRPCRRVWAL